MSRKHTRKAEVLKGTLDLMVLQSVATLGPLHGYTIAARLEQRGFLRATWALTDTNRQARFYAITAAGRRQLATEKAEWDRMTAIIGNLLHEER